MAIIEKHRTVKIQDVSTPGPWAKYSCGWCEEVSDSVERRVYGNEYSVLGFSVYFKTNGMNEYCPVCGEPVEYKKKDDIPEPIRDKALTWKEEKWVHAAEGKTESPEVENV